MSEVFEFIKKKTSKEVKITSQDIINSLELNEASIHKNLRDLCKHGDINYKEFKIRRTKNGREYIFKKKVFWID